MSGCPTGGWERLAYKQTPFKLRVYRVFSFRRDSNVANSAQACKPCPPVKSKQRAHNASLRTAFRTAVKKYWKQSKRAISCRTSGLPKSRQSHRPHRRQGRVHKTKRRHKSRLSAKVKALAWFFAKTARRLIRDKRKTLKPDGFRFLCARQNRKWRKGCGFIESRYKMPFESNMPTMGAEMNTRNMRYILLAQDIADGVRFGETAAMRRFDGQSIRVWRVTTSFLRHSFRLRR